MKSQNIFWTTSKITQEERERRNKHKGGIIWLTGLSGAGKSTIAVELERRLFSLGHHTYVLDGDNIRHGLSANLGFSAEDRSENIRRIAEVSKLFVDAGVICISAFISPDGTDRRMARSLVEEGQFVEVYVKASLEVCENRDTKGLYKLARAGRIMNFTGISAPYDVPENPEITVNTECETVADSVATIMKRLREMQWIS